MKDIVVIPTEIRGDDRAGPGLHSKLAEIRSLQQRAAEGLIALERSLALEALWPNVFDGPKGVTSTWHGKPLRASNLSGYRDGVIRYDLLLRVTNAKGCSRDFPQDAVPPILWPSTTKGVL
jgi:hypothetical protein